MMLSVAGKMNGLAGRAILLARGAILLAREMWNVARIAALADAEYCRVMPTIDEVKRLALNLPEKDRANLAADLLQSLLAVLHDDDGGIAEALRRDAELDANPELGISLEELRRRVRG